MGDTRIRYGLAYGKMNNFVTGSTDQTTRGYLAGSDGLFKQADTTPDVTNGILFYTNNSAATTITHFDLQHPSSALVGSNSTNLSGLFEGKVIKLFFLDTNTTIANNSRIVLSGSANQLFNANSHIDFVYHTSSWYEMCRSQVLGLASTVSRTVDVGTNTAITVTGADSVIYLHATSLVAVINGLNGGFEGQHISITKLLSDTGSSIKFSATNSSGIGNLFFSGTSDFMMVVPASTGVEILDVIKAGTGWFVSGLIK